MAGHKRALDAAGVPTQHDGGEKMKVGLNCYKKEAEKRTVEFHPYNIDAATRQVEKLKRKRMERNNEKVKILLEAVREDATKNTNLMPSIIAAVKEYTTVGEIIGALKEVYGEYDEPIFF